MGFAAHAAIGHAGDAEYDGFHFSGHELLAADINHLTHAAKNAERAIRALLYFVAGSKPPVGGKAFVIGVKIAGNLRAATQPEFVVDDLPFEVRVFEAQECGASLGALGPRNACLTRAEGLDETDARESLLQAEQ